MAALALAAGSLAACSHSTGGTGTPASPAVASLTASAPEPVGAGRAQSLSPNGQKVVVHGGAGLCVANVDGSGQRCIPAASAIHPSDWVVWSPDSAFIAFTNDFFQQFQEPDVWIMDTSSGVISDLTEDNADKVGDPGAVTDLFPQFSADGKTIFFARQSAAAPNRIDFMARSVDTGDLTTIASESGSIRRLAGAAFTASVVASVTYDADYRHGSVSLIKRGGAATPVAGLSSLDNSLVSFSADGDYLLVDSALPYAQYVKVVDNAAVVRVSDTAVTPVARDVSAVMWPTWSLTGDSIVFVSGQAGAEQLRVAAAPGGSSRSVLDKPQLGAGGNRLSWSHTGAVLLYINGDPNVVQLGA